MYVGQVRNNGHGMFHIALTTSLGRSAADANKARGNTSHTHLFVEY